MRACRGVGVAIALGCGCSTQRLAAVGTGCQRGGDSRRAGRCPRLQVTTVAADPCLKLVETWTAHVHSNIAVPALWGDAVKGLSSLLPREDALRRGRSVTTAGAAGEPTTATTATPRRSATLSAGCFLPCRRAALGAGLPRAGGTAERRGRGCWAVGGGPGRTGRRTSARGLCKWASLRVCKLAGAIWRCADAGCGCKRVAAVRSVALAVGQGGQRRVRQRQRVGGCASWRCRARKCAGSQPHGGAQPLQRRGAAREHRVAGPGAVRRGGLRALVGNVSF